MPKMTMAQALELDALDVKRRERVSKRTILELSIVMSNWDGWNRLAQMGSALWEAAGNNEIDPERYFIEEQPIETQVIADADWG